MSADVTKDLLKALKIVTSQLERVGDTRKHKDGEFIDLGREAIARAEASLSSSDDAPSSAEERRLRRMLCRQRHGVSAYMDDGEATFGGDEFQRPTDYLRESLDSIEQAWIEAGRKLVAQAEPQPDAGLIARDDVIRMAREAGFTWEPINNIADPLERFAGLVASAERKACIAITKEAVEGATISKYATSLEVLAARGMATHLIDAIRARGQK